jgi:hypothetical protein
VASPERFLFEFIFLFRQGNGEVLEVIDGVSNEELTDILAFLSVPKSYGSLNGFLLSYNSEEVPLIELRLSNSLIKGVVGHVDADLETL